MWRRKAVGQVSWFLQYYIIPYFHITPFLTRGGCDMVNFNPMAHGIENVTKSAHYPVMYLCTRRLCLTRLQVVSKIFDFKSITRTLPKRPNQFRYWYPKLRAKPYLPEYKRESIIIGTTLDVAEEPQRLPRQDARWGVARFIRLMHTSHAARQMDDYCWPKAMGPGLEYWSP
jgi:hypothetical protein